MGLHCYYQIYPCSIASISGPIRTYSNIRIYRINTYYSIIRKPKPVVLPLLIVQMGPRSFLVVVDLRTSSLNCCVLELGIHIT